MQSPSLMQIDTVIAVNNFEVLLVVRKCQETVVARGLMYCGSFRQSKECGSIQYFLLKTLQYLVTAISSVYDIITSYRNSVSCSSKYSKTMPLGSSMSLGRSPIVIVFVTATWCGKRFSKDVHEVDACLTSFDGVAIEVITI